MTYVGYDTAKVVVASFKPLRITLGEREVFQQAVEIVEIRISQKQQESPLTIETMDALAVRESPSPDLEPIYVPGVRPERLRTLEVGYKGIWKERLFIDVGYFFSWY